MKIQALVAITLRQGAKDIFQIEKLKLGAMNDDYIVRPSEQQPLSIFKIIPEDEMLVMEKVLRKPIEFDYQNGLIVNPTVFPEDVEWSVDIKKSILSIFRLKLSKEHRIVEDEQFQLPLEVSPVQMKHFNFKTLEKSIGGECETLYTIKNSPYNPMTELTKVFDYQKCRKRPIELETMLDALKKPHHQEQKVVGEKELIDSVAHIRYNITNLETDFHRLPTLQQPVQFVIYNAVVEGMHKFTPYTEQTGSLVAYVNATLKLYQTIPVSQNNYLNLNHVPIQQGIPIESINSVPLTEYQHVQERILQQQPYVYPTGPLPLEEERILTPQQMEFMPDMTMLPETLKDLLVRLVHDLNREVKPETAKLVYWIKHILSKVTFQQLLQTHELIKQHQFVVEPMTEPLEPEMPVITPKSHLLSLWFDVLANVGARKTTLLLEHLITKELVGTYTSMNRQQELLLSDERLAQVFAQLSLVTKDMDGEMLKKLVTICSTQKLNPLVYPQSQKACWLSLGSLFYETCHMTDHTVMPVQYKLQPTLRSRHCSLDTKQIIQQTLKQKVINAPLKEKLIYIKAIGNGAMLQLIPELHQIIKMDKIPSHLILRTQAIYAFRRIVELKPEIVRKILLPVYLNQEEDHRVRIAAFIMLVRSDTGITVMEEIAQSLHRETSVLTGTFVYQYFMGLANSTIPADKALSQKAIKVLTFTKHFELPSLFLSSHYININKYFQDMDAGFVWELALLADPSGKSYLPSSVYSKFDTQLFGLKTNVMEFGFDLYKGVDKFILDILQENTFGKVFKRVFMPEQYPQEEEYLTRQPQPDLLGQVYLKFLGKEIRFWEITPQFIREQIFKQTHQTEFLRQFVLQKKPLLLPTVHKVLDVINLKLKIRSEIGLPIVLEAKAPVVGKFGGLIKVINEISQQPLTGVELDAFVQIAGELTTQLYVDGKFVQPGAMITTKIQSKIPLKKSIVYSKEEGRLRLKYLVPPKPVELIEIDAVPSTFIAIHPVSFSKMATPTKYQEYLRFRGIPLNQEYPTFEERYMSKPFRPLPEYLLFHHHHPKYQQQLKYYTKYHPSQLLPEYLQQQQPRSLQPEMITPVEYQQPRTLQPEMINPLETPLTLRVPLVYVKEIDNLDQDKMIVFDKEFPERQVAHDFGLRVHVHLRLENPFKPEIPLIPVTGRKVFRLVLKPTDFQYRQPIPIFWDLWFRKQLHTGQILNGFHKWWPLLPHQQEQEQILPEQVIRPDLQQFVPNWSQLMHQLTADMRPDLLFPQNERLGLKSFHTIQSKLSIGPNQREIPVFQSVLGLYRTQLESTGPSYKWALVLNTPMQTKMCILNHIQYPRLPRIPDTTTTRVAIQPLKGIFEMFWGVRSCNLPLSVIRQQTMQQRQVQVPTYSQVPFVQPLGYFFFEFHAEKSKEQLPISSPEIIHQDGYTHQSPYSYNPVPVESYETKTVFPGKTDLVRVHKKCQKDVTRGAIYSRACVRLMELHNQLLQYRIHVDYHKIPLVFHKLFHKVDLWLKTFFFWNVKTTPVYEPLPIYTTPIEPKWKSIVRISPDGHMIDWTYKTPMEKVEFFNLPVPAYVSLPFTKILTPKHKFQHLFFGHDYICRFTGPKLISFDQHEIDDVPFSNCYKTLAKDCRPSHTVNPLWEVLIAKERMVKKLKIVFPVLRKFIEIVPQPEWFNTIQQQQVPMHYRPYIHDPRHFQVIVNGQRIPVTERQRMIRLTGMFAPDELVVEYVRSHENEDWWYGDMPKLVFNLVKHHVKIEFDGINVLVKPDPMMMSEVCGLCGNFDRNPMNDLFIRGQKLSVPEFVREHLKDKQCQSPLETLIDTPYKKTLFPVYPKHLIDEPTFWQDRTFRTPYGTPLPQPIYNQIQPYQTIPTYQQQPIYPQPIVEQEYQPYHRRPVQQLNPYEPIQTSPCLKMKTDVKEVEHQICFSVEPVKKCDELKGCVPQSPMEQERVQRPYTCLEKTNLLVPEWERLAQVGVIPDVRTSPIHRHLYTVVPLSCKKI